MCKNDRRKNLHQTSQKERVPEIVKSGSQAIGPIKQFRLSAMTLHITENSKSQIKSKIQK